jgi:DNA end-binding protein Ku
MSARAIGSGTIGFGLVSIPVKLYSTAIPSAEFHFNQLHAECGTRIRQKLYCPTHDRIVERGELIRGWEFARGKWVTLTGDELKAVEEQSTGDIAIVEFVPLADVDPVYFDKAYWLGPDKGGGRAYRLLAAALAQTGLCALATYAARGKQHLVLLRPADKGLVLQQLFHAFELRPFAEVPMDGAEPRPDELALAVALVRQAAAPAFRPEKYRDDVHDRIEALIERKVAGEDIRLAAAESPRAEVIDLMEALKASLGLAAAPAGDERASGGEG